MKVGGQRVRWSAEKFSAVSAFCKQEGITLLSFYRWRDRVGSVYRPRRRAAVVARKTPAVSEFIPLTALPMSSRLELKFDLGGGIVLTVTR